MAALDSDLERAAGDLAVLAAGAVAYLPAGHPRRAELQAAVDAVVVELRLRADRLEARERRAHALELTGWR